MPMFRSATHPDAATIRSMPEPMTTFALLPQAAPLGGLARDDARLAPASVQAPPPARDLVLDIADEAASLQRLRDDWNDLYDRSARSPSLFQTHAWLAAWSRHFTGHDGAIELAVVTVRRHGRLVAALPLALRRRLGLRQLEWAGAPVSQYGDALVDPGLDAAAILDRAWAHAVAGLKPDLVHLRKVRADAAIAPLLARAGFRSSGPQQAPAMDFGTSPDFSAYEQRYSAKARKNRRRLLRRLEEQGEVRFVHLAPSAEAAATAARAIDMKRAWLAHRGLLSPALDDARVAAFFRDACATPAGDGATLVSALKLDGAPIAIMVAVTGGDRVAGHIFTYDLAFEKSGAGVLLLEDCLRRACADGYRYYDLLAPADGYKSDWADHAVEVADHTVALTARGALYDKVYLGVIRPAGRDLLMRLAKRRAQPHPCPEER